jgi:asparagine synthase (glutamine-hydrolysing)
MCGIAGIVRRGAAVEPEELAPMLDALGHRGPDGSGVFTSGPFGLAHTRLAIIDLAGGNQPMMDGTSRLALAANGEIYNFVELREELEAQGRCFATRSDSETILQAYAVNRHDFIDSLHGMYAFALVDEARQRLILARDRLGIKPLFYTRLPDRLIFASEIKAILPFLPGAPDINATAFSEFLHDAFASGRRTVLAGIHRVLPGELVEIDAELGVSRRRYWSTLDIAPREISLDEAAEELDSLLHRVTREHLRSDVPYGLFLSGGNDSAILLALHRRVRNEPLRTFSIGYGDDTIRDELADAERIAGIFGARRRSIRLQPSSLFRRLPLTVWACDELMRDYASLPTAALAETASAELKVVLTGEGGDEVFGGYRRYRKHPLVSLERAAGAPGSGGFRTRSSWRRRGGRKALGNELLQHVDDFRRPFVEAWASTPRGWSHLQRCQHTDLVTALPDNLLVKVDRNLMAFGVEGRVPFLDSRVVEFGLSLPDRLKVANGNTKVLLRHWAERYLPKDHLYKKKTGFVVPAREWLSGELLDGLESRLMANHAIREWFNVGRLPALFAAQRRRNLATREIFCLTQFAIWHQLFIERPGARPSADEDPLDWIG